MPRGSQSRLVFQTGGTAQFSSAIRELRRANKQLPTDFMASVRTVAVGLRDTARAKALAIPTNDRGHTGLRKEVAKGVRIVPIPNGLRIITEMPQEAEAIIPRGMDTEKGWRHPVFGRQSNWVVQRSLENNWFMETMLHGAEPLRARLIGNVNSAAEFIAAATKI